MITQFSYSITASFRHIAKLLEYCDCILVITSYFNSAFEKSYVIIQWEYRSLRFRDGLSLASHVLILSGDPFVKRFNISLETLHVKISRRLHIVFLTGGESNHFGSDGRCGAM